MDPMISLGQKNTLAEYMILSGADNRPPVLDKDLYDSWKIEENGAIRTKKYGELSDAKKIQADCDMKAINIILQGFPIDIYSLVNHHRLAKDLWERVQLLMQGTSLTKQERECKLYDAFDKFTHIKGESLHILPPEWSKFVTDVKLVKDLHTSNFDQLHAYLEQHELHANEVCFVVPVFSPGDDPIACLNKAMDFLTFIASSRLPTTNNQLRTSSNPRNQATIQDGRELLNATTAKVKDIWLGNALSQTRNAAWYKEKAMLAKAQEAGQILDEEQLAFLADPGIPASQTQTVIPHNATFQTKDLDTYDSDCDDLSSAQAVLMANIYIYGYDIISEVPNSETYLNDMDNQSVHVLQDFEQSPVMDFTNNDVSSDSNIIPYSQYLQETQQATFQDAHFQAQQDSMILSVIKQMSEQMINHVNNWEKANKEQNNESITA
ncbi:hypothetical protein Tco_0533097 [Tanacetum coccineum]